MLFFICLCWFFEVSGGSDDGKCTLVHLEFAAEGLLRRGLGEDGPVRFHEDSIVEYSCFCGVFSRVDHVEVSEPSLNPHQALKRPQNGASGTGLGHFPFQAVQARFNGSEMNLRWI